MTVTATSTTSRIRQLLTEDRQLTAKLLSEAIEAALNPSWSYRVSASETGSESTFAVLIRLLGRVRAKLDANAAALSNATEPSNAIVPSNATVPYVPDDFDAVNVTMEAIASPMFAVSLSQQFPGSSFDVTDITSEIVHALPPPSPPSMPPSPPLLPPTASMAAAPTTAESCVNVNDCGAGQICNCRHRRRILFGLKRHHTFCFCSRD